MPNYAEGRRQRKDEASSRILIQMGAVREAPMSSHFAHHDNQRLPPMFFTLAVYHTQVKEIPHTCRFCVNRRSISPSELTSNPTLKGADDIYKIICLVTEAKRATHGPALHQCYVIGKLHS